MVAAPIKFHSVILFSLREQGLHVNRNFRALFIQLYSPTKVTEFPGGGPYFVIFDYFECIQCIGIKKFKSFICI